MYQLIAILLALSAMNRRSSAYRRHWELACRGSLPTLKNSMSSKQFITDAFPQRCAVAAIEARKYINLFPQQALAAESVTSCIDENRSRD